MMDLFLDAFAHLEKNPAFWLCLTLSFYVLGQVIFKAAKFNPFLSPIIISVVCLISFLVATGVPYETYSLARISFISCLARLLWRLQCRFMNNAQNLPVCGCRC